VYGSKILMYRLRTPTSKKVVYSSMHGHGASQYVFYSFAMTPSTRHRHLSEPNSEFPNSTMNERV
jgi:hypothetical protein